MTSNGLRQMPCGPARVRRPATIRSTLLGLACAGAAFDTSISDVSSTGVVYNGTVDSRIDIVSVGLHYRWDDPAQEKKTRLFVK